MPEPSIVTMAQVAARFNVSRARVCQMLNLLKLPEEIKGYLLSIKDTEEHNYFTERKLRQIATLDDPSEQTTLFCKIREQYWNEEEKKGSFVLTGLI